MSGSNHPRLGFTLLEILIALVMVGVLASIGFINFLGTIEKARAGDGVQLLQQALMAAKRYKVENMVYPTNQAQMDFGFPDSSNFWNEFKISTSDSGLNRGVAMVIFRNVRGWNTSVSVPYGLGTTSLNSMYALMIEYNDRTSQYAFTCHEGKPGICAQVGF